MRKIFILLFSLIQVSLFAQNNILYYQKTPSELAARKITKAELKADINFWHTVMEESHVNLYHAISKEELIRLQDSVINHLPESLTHQQAVFALGALAGALNEGHIYLPGSEITDSLYNNHAIRFPFALSNISNGNFIISANWSSNQVLQKGDAIISINGKPTKDLYNHYRKYIGGLEPWRMQLVSSFIRKMLFVDEFTSPYTIQAIKNNTDTVILTVDGLNRAAIDSLNKVLSTQQIKQSTPFSFTIRDNEIGYIAFNSMSRSLKDSFSRFLNSTFSFIKEKQLKGLVIDLRENSGGDSQVGELLLNYITTKHYRMGGGMKWKVSKHYKAYLDIVKDDDEDYRKKDNGEMFEYINPATKKPLNNAFTFNGKVAVLIGPNTFSSANMLADAIKEYQLATLFGEPTGECGNDYGETFDFMLSNTHIISRATSKMFIRASGDETDFSATTPNVFAKNINFKSDAVLETAVRWIFEGKQ